MSSLAATACELIELPPEPAAVLLRDIGGGRERGASLSVRGAVSLLAQPMNSSTDHAEVESLMEEPERWDGLS